MLKTLQILFVLLIISCFSDKKEKLKQELYDAEKEFLESKYNLKKGFENFNDHPQKKSIHSIRETLKYNYHFSPTPTNREGLESFLVLIKITNKILLYYKNVEEDVWLTKIDDDIHYIWVLTDNLEKEINILSNKIPKIAKEFYEETKKLYELLHDTTNKKRKWNRLKTEYNEEIRSHTMNRPNDSSKYGPIYIIS